MTPDNLQEHIAALYADHPLTLFGEEDKDRTLSTISQLSFVLHMLDMLQPGQKVFKLGTGSGWNAALMGYLVGPKGHVYSIDILPEIASRRSGGNCKLWTPKRHRAEWRGRRRLCTRRTV